MNARTGPPIFAAFLLALLLLGWIGAVSYRNMLRLIGNAAEVAHTHEVVAE
jgi:CHASE3 domain sensor protein